jgi:hypothetical protein
MPDMFISEHIIVSHSVGLFTYAMRPERMLNVIV